MKRSRIAARLGSLAILLLVGALTFTSVEAKPEDNKGDRRKGGEPANQAWSDPMVMGVVQDTFWVEGKEKDTKTPVIQVWSNEGDLLVTVYGDGPAVRDAIVSGRGCVGRYVVV